MKYFRPIIFLLLATAATPAFANMVWPALYLETRLFTWWAIGIGLLVELLAIRIIFNISWRRSAIASIAANAGSALLGLPLIPLAGIAWEFFPGSLYMGLLDWGTFNPVTWAATFVIACLLNAFIEGFILRRWFKLPVGKKQFWLLVLANAVSVGVAFGSLFVVPVQA